MILGIFCLIIFLLIARIGYIQIVQPDKYATLAMRQQQTDRIVPAKRGSILDRNGKELAISITTFDIWVEKSNYTVKNDEQKTTEKRKQFASIVSPNVGMSEEDVLKKFEGNALRFELAKKIENSKVDEIKAQLKDAKLRGVSYYNNQKRFYPYGNFAPYVLGHLSTNNFGVAGVEQFYDDKLGGIDGRQIVFTDRDGNVIEDSSEQYYDPIEGNNVVLTIDEVIQHYMEQAVNKGLVTHRAKQVIAIAMDPINGDILGMAKSPGYDPNNPNTPQNAYYKTQLEQTQNEEERGKELYQMWRNTAVNDIYEPGSPFKLVTAAAGIEENAVSLQSLFTDVGYRIIGPNRIGNFRPEPFGTITFKTAIALSVNTYFMEVAARLGGGTYLDYVHDFGFGKKTGIDLPGEAVGLVKKKESLKEIDLATMSFGQGIATTPIQMLSMVASFGNGGQLMKPNIVKQIVDQNGTVVESRQPTVIRRVVSESTAKDVMEGMVAVVEEGAKAAIVDGYTVGGKSGTAQKPSPRGGYMDGKYITSFTALAPIENPRIALIVLVDEPGGSNVYGSTIAAPIAQEILSNSLRYMDGAEMNTETTKESVIIPDLKGKSIKEAQEILKSSELKFDTATQSSKEDGIVSDSFPQAGEKVQKGSTIRLYLEGQTDNSQIVPDVRGRTLAEVQAIAKEMGLRLSISGSGTAVSQEPAAGSLVSKDGFFRVTFRSGESESTEPQATEQQQSESVGESVEESERAMNRLEKKNPDVRTGVTID